jgi:7-carboxy-7-deazaguanine synthase
VVVEPAIQQQPRAKDAEVTTTTLRLTEVFLSLQGETSRAGLPTVFIRLSGARCVAAGVIRPTAFRAATPSP